MLVKKIDYSQKVGNKDTEPKKSVKISDRA